MSLEIKTDASNYLESFRLTNAKKSDDHNILISEVDQEANNTESIHLKHSIQTYDKNKETYVNEDAQCISVTDEDVHLWVNDDFIIIWSCALKTNLFTREGPDADGAVIMAWFPPRLELVKVDIKEVMARLKVVAEKYLGPPTIEVLNIDWTQGPQYLNGDPDSMFDCVMPRG